MPKRVLLATNDATFSAALAAAYRAHGFEVRLGLNDFRLRQGEFDLVHLHWPEELLDWHLPFSPTAAQEAIGLIDWWRARTRVICTVHNLLPHNMRAGDVVTPAFYQTFYERMERIGHFSRTSLEAVRARFPDLDGGKHIVHGMNLFDDLRSLGIGREAARARFGIEPTGFVVATLGALRKPVEARLSLEALRKAARAPGVEILFGARPTGTRLRRLRMSILLATASGWSNLRRFRDRLTSEEMVALLEAADALLVPRSDGHLNSGLLPLAMTFGTPIVAPDAGVFREVLGGSGNPLYTPGSPTEMAGAIDRLRRADAKAVRAANLQLARDWGWPRALDRLLEGY